ncbi:hypothetical protein [Paracoccus fontiphilus]|uniref:Uncharacterized protein n=1 Tax=Paracoccus fontiphilus TaxID=1815556 RepID=A0ABV7IB20_9RHOB|nr:hypothetical protein [Paracoccus fontiphilus]
MIISGELVLVLTSAVFGGATTYRVWRHWPDRESPKPDLEKVNRFIESVSKDRAEVLDTD